MNNQVDLKDTTFLIPVRIDSLERFENLLCVTNYILRYFDTNIEVVEADKENNFLLKNHLNDSINLTFIEDHDEIFHRTKYINLLARQITTPFVAIWDADVFVHPKQILASLAKLRDNDVDFVYPYDGRFVETGVAYRGDFIRNLDIVPLEKGSDEMFLPYTMIACGGGFFARKEAYQKSGMENEKFYGWGPEDGERLKRWKILGMRIIRVVGPMFHLFHPLGINSTFKSEQSRKDLLGELERIGDMTKLELEQEIYTWKWLEQAIS